MELREQIRALKAIESKAKKEVTEGAEDAIIVSSTTRRVAHAYERFRNVLEPDEADLLRRKALWRMLDRRLREDKPPHVIATAILQELVRAHYTKTATQADIKPITEYVRRAAHMYPRLKAGLNDLFLDVVAVAIDRHL